MQPEPAGAVETSVPRRPYITFYDLDSTLTSAECVAAFYDGRVVRARGVPRGGPWTVPEQMFSTRQDRIDRYPEQQ